MRKMNVTTMMAMVSAVSMAPAETRAEGRLHVFQSGPEGFDTRSYFYDDGQEVVAFDTQFTPELARRSLELLRTRTRNPVTYVVLTHPNPDKFNGMRVFQEQGARVIASRRTAEAMPGVHEYKKYFFVQVAKMFTDATYPALSRLDVVFDQAYDLRLRSGERIELRELSGPGVSSNQTVAYLPSIRSALVGDLIHHRAHAWLEGGIVDGKPTPTLRSWIQGLRELGQRIGDPYATVYGGRGDPASLAVAVRDQTKYLLKADRIVTRYLAELGERRSELQGEKAGEHYRELQARFEREFPGYALGYLIQYGVYGLVNSKL